jgi:tetratricopeptide (TPR) repeat protein
VALVGEARFQCDVHQRQVGGDFAGAAADYTQVIVLAPSDSEAHRGRGYAELSQQKYDAAISDLTEAITLNPSDALAYKFRGMAYSGKHDIQHAVSDDQNSIRLGK